MGRLVLGAILGAALLAGGALLLWRTGAGDPCLGRCGEGTRCAAEHCVATSDKPDPPARKERKRRGSRGEATAPAAPRLRPGDERPVAQGDALGRPERIDLTVAGDDGHELAQDDVDRVMRGADGAISRCITDALGELPLETARVEVGLRIERAGSVSRVRVEGPAALQRQGLTPCVRQVVTGLRFPPSGGASVVTYPFALR